ncbi:unnamed protein product [Schistosoma margrebowiei]|uniref:Uncharacterized protein n=1 Tax=Schistosoma margrebowiei TaxID=48269 RepID=A0A183M0P9_9TREM|nr:unnamed protein product [Schistosoma margrebowiei]
MKTSKTQGSHGIQWAACIKLDDSDFADNLVLLSHQQQQIQVKTTSVAKASASVGLNTQRKKQDP